MQDYVFLTKKKNQEWVFVAVHNKWETFTVIFGHLAHKYLRNGVLTSEAKER